MMALFFVQYKLRATGAQLYRTTFQKTIPYLNAVAARVAQAESIAMKHETFVSSFVRYQLELGRIPGR